MRFYPPTVLRPAQPLSKIQGLIAVMRNPLEFWSDDMFENSISAVQLPRQTFVTVTDPALAQHIFLDHAADYEKSHFVNRLLRPAMGAGLLTAEDASWRAQRRAAAPVFRPDNVAALGPIMSKAGAALSADLTALPSGSRVDVMGALIAATLDVIIDSFFGEARDLYDSAQISSDIMTYLETHGNLGLADYLGLPEWLPRKRHRGRKAISRLRLAAQRVIAGQGPAMRAEQSDQARVQADLATLLGRMQDPETGQALSPTALVDNVLTFIGAGHETVALSVTWALSILAHLPQLQADIRHEIAHVCPVGPITAAHAAELPLTLRVLHETMRLYPPAAAIGRSVVAPTQLGGMMLKPGDHVTISTYVIHRHRQHWDDPEAFDPDRFFPEAARARHRFAYMPFGGGGRICIGQSFALQEAVILLAHLLRDLRFAPDPDHQIYPQFAITLRPRNGLPLFIERVKT